MIEFVIATTDPVAQGNEIFQISRAGCEHGCHDHDCWPEDEHKQQQEARHAHIDVAEDFDPPIKTTHH